MKRHLGYCQFFTRGRLFPGSGCRRWVLAFRRSQPHRDVTEVDGEGKSKAMEKLRLVFVYKHEEKRRSAAHRNSCNY